MNYFTFWITLILVAALAVYTGAQALPLLVLLYFPRLLKFWFIDQAESERWINASPAVQEKIQQLQPLGFELLGIKGEKILWQKPVFEASLANHKKESFAALMLKDDPVEADTKSFHVLGSYILTSFNGGGIIFTRGRSSMPEMESPVASVRNIATGDYKQMISTHSQRVASFKKRGFKPLPALDQASRIEATYVFYSSSYIRQARRSLTRMLPVINFVLALVLLIAIIATYIANL
jgi:hypothetical protein